MDHVLVRKLSFFEHASRLRAWALTTPDGSVLDEDIFNHQSTFLMGAFNRSGMLAYLPVQQPLMLENLLFRPGLSTGETAQAITRLAEHAIEECFVRDAGEAYFLCRDKSTLTFAERHHFRELPEQLQVRRLNLAEHFGG